MLKKYFLLFAILFALKSFTIVNAQNPSIGFILQEEYLFSDPEVFNGYRTIYLNIKNTGDEVLNNINIIDNGLIDSYTNCLKNNITFPCSDLSLETLNPNDELNLTVLIYNTGNCFEDIQFEVNAITPNGSQINDFSDNNSYDFNNYTFVTMNESSIDFSFNATYIDVNNNSMLDLGDAIEYSIDSSLYSYGINYPNDIYDLNPINLYNNEVVTVSSVNNTIGGNSVIVNYSLTAADIAIGYAYYLPEIIYQSFDSCTFVSSNQINTCFNCPEPDNCELFINNGYIDCIKTNLTDLLPNRISGNVTFDSNNNGCSTGINYPNRRVNASTNGATFSSFTNQLGEYSIYIPNINIYNTTAALNLNPEFTSNPANYSITSSGSDQVYNADFCISSTNNFTDLKLLIIPDANAVPGFNTSYRVLAYNQGSTSLNGSITLTYDPVLATLFEQTPTSNTSTANSLTWNFSNLLPFQSENYIVAFTISTPPTVESDDLVTFTVTSTQDIADNNPINNQYVLNQIAVNSFDPNDKTILEGPLITPEQADGYLHFLTRFQNEGTAPATNVVITEVLHNTVDTNTFEPIASSHDVDVQLIGNNQLTYTFSDINLPHATADEAGSHGWMLYKAKPRSWFNNNSILYSKSDIYFDFNPAIVTNEATTQIGVLSTNTFNKSAFKVFPNPAKNKLNISAIDNEKYSISIFDINGREIFNDTFSNNRTIDISSYQTGFYIVSIFNSKGKLNYKLIKE